MFCFYLQSFGQGWVEQTAAQHWSPTCWSTWDFSKHDLETSGKYEKQFDKGVSQLGSAWAVSKGVNVFDLQRFEKSCSLQPLGDIFSLQTLAFAKNNDRSVLSAVFMKLGSDIIKGTLPTCPAVDLCSTQQHELRCGATVNMQAKSWGFYKRFWQKCQQQKKKKEGGTLFCKSCRAASISSTAEFISAAAWGAKEEKIYIKSNVHHVKGFWCLQWGALRLVNRCTWSLLGQTAAPASNLPPATVRWNFTSASYQQRPKLHK